MMCCQVSNTLLLGSCASSARCVVFLWHQFDNDKIVSGGWDKLLRVHDLRQLGGATSEAESATVRTLYGHGDAVFSLRYCNESARIVSGSADTTVNVWDMQP